MLKDKKAVFSSLGLLLCAVVWGSSFAVIKNSMDILKPLQLSTLRYAIATIAMVPFYYKKIKTINRKIIIDSVIAGFILFLGNTLQVVGTSMTSASNSAFLTSVYVVLVPLMIWAVKRVFPGAKTIAAAVMAFVGIGLLSFGEAGGINVGDLIVFGCGVVYAVQILVLAKYNMRYDVGLFTVLQLAVTAVFSAISVPFFEGPIQSGIFSGEILFSVLYLGVVCSALTMLLYNIGLKYTPSSFASLIMSLESVFGAVFAAILLGEKLNVQAKIGCVVVFAAIVLSQVSFKKAAVSGGDTVPKTADKSE